MARSACGKRLYYIGSKALKASQLRRKKMVKKVNGSQKQIVALQGELSTSNQKVTTLKTENEERQGTIEALRIEASQAQQQNAALQHKVGNLLDTLEYSTKYNEEKVLEAKYEAHYVRTTLQLCRDQVFTKEEAWKEKMNFLKNVFCKKRDSLEVDIAKFLQDHEMFTKAWQGNMSSVYNIFREEIKFLSSLIVELENQEA